MISDQESQEDELLALASIYDDESFLVTSPGDEGDMAGGQFSAQLELPQPFHVLFSSPQKDDSKTHDLQFLPPITLHFQLPQDYPSSKPPQFTLSCKWLTEPQLSRLCIKLDDIWEENRGEVILFLWTVFLKDEATGFLCLSSPMDLSNVVKRHRSRYKSPHTSRDSHKPNISSTEKPSIFTEDNGEALAISNDRGAASSDNSADNAVAVSQSDPVDPRVVQDIASQELLLAAILEHDREQKEKVFNMTLFTCQVCISEKLGSLCLAFHDCGHVYCKDCMAGYFEVQIQEGNVQGLICPSDKCESQAHPTQVKNLVAADQFARYDRLLLQSSLDTMSDLVYCPRQACRAAVLQDQESGMGRCPACHFVFCVYCKLAYHGVSPCRVKEDEVRILRESYKNATEEEKRAMERRYGRRAIKQIIEDSYTNEWLQEYSKQCPHCKAHIQKIDGCNKMTCTKCHAFFCWLCEKIISRNNPYGHFNNPVSECYNQLFQGVVFNEDDFHELELEEGDDEDDFVVFV